LQKKLFKHKKMSAKKADISLLTTHHRGCSRGTTHRSKWALLLAYLFAIQLLCPEIAYAADRTVDLVIGYKTVNFTGKSAKAMAINGQIPAPTLHFKEGDHITINVYNHLDKGTTLHWHGILLPWQMDGVEHITQDPIPPGGVFHYKFTLKQSGTYWYHAHAHLQEQEGLYGAFIIDPLQPPHYKYNQDYTVVLSDWNNANAEQTLANLKKDGDFYSPKFPLQPSLTHFMRSYRKANSTERKQLIAAYKMMQNMRMSVYDYSDVAYDTFLLNGKPPTEPWNGRVKIGDVVRLRFIDAGGSTIFNVKIPGTKMQLVQVQGNDVQPHYIDSFSITPGETYDVLVKITENSPYIIYAESIDTLGAAYGALTTSSQQSVNYKKVIPFPEPGPIMMMGDMPGMDMGGNSHSMSMAMKNDNMSMSATMPEMNMPDMDMNTTPTKYADLKAIAKTNDPNKPIARVIHMQLNGYMGQYIWFLNGVPEYKAKPILIEPGKRYRIIFDNPSMMRHPMHIHGHFFILRNGHGAYDPLLHTIDVPPGATITADFDTDAKDGWWFFHCHNLYHMMAGMSGVFHYATPSNSEKINQSIAKNSAHYHQLSPAMSFNNTSTDPYGGLAHPPMLYRATFLDVENDFFNNVQGVTFKTLYGGDYNKLELYTEDAELSQGSVEYADLDIFYWRLISQFWAIKGGVNYMYRPAVTPYWQPGIGIEGIMPYFIDTNIRSYYHDGSVKFDIQLSRDSQLTDNFFIRTGVRSILATQTVAQDEVGSGLSEMRFIVRPYYRLRPGLSAFFEYEYKENYGATRSIRANAGEAYSENTYSLGLAFLF